MSKYINFNDKSYIIIKHFPLLTYAKSNNSAYLIFYNFFCMLNQNQNMLKSSH